MEELKYSISYASQKDLVNFNNDVALCYDRIIPPLASLIGQKKGLHKDIMWVHANTLKEAKFKLKTVLGVNKDYYQNCQAFPIMELGRGVQTLQ
eukprot:2658141-Ditylum_brightwellii.AAC.1